MRKQIAPTIFHIDVNSAFLSWSALDDLEKGSTVDLREIPSIIGGDVESRHGVVLAKSIPAKAYKIHTGEPVVSALRKCPGLTIHKPDHKLYSRRSRELMECLSDVCPDIEQVSIDECFMDFTSVSHLYSDPVSAAVRIKESVYEKFGFTVNIGISDRKVLAKMASDFEKPNKVHTLYSWEIQEKMWPLPVSELYSCGGSSVETLRKLEILTIGDLAQADVSILELHLKSHGRTLWEYANGIDESAVNAQPEDAKCIGNSNTFGHDVVTTEEAHRELLLLSESVAARLRKAQVHAGMVSTEIRYASFHNVSHQTTLTAPSNSTDVIYQTACKLFDEIWNGKPVRLLGVRTSKLLSPEEPEQMDLFTYQKNKLQSEKLQKLDAALDDIRKRYGKQAVVRGSLLPVPADTEKINT